MGRLREWPKSLLDSISQRGQTPSPQTPSPQEAPQKSSESKKDAALRRAAIAGAIGVGLTGLGIMGDQKLQQLTVAEKAALAASNAALLAGAVGTYTASEGSVLARAAKGLGAGVLATTAVTKLGQLSGVNPLKFGEGARPYV